VSASFQDLDLEGLAAQEPLELPEPLLELAHLGVNDLVVDPDRVAAACGHPLPPLERQARRDAVLAGYKPERHARLQRVLDQPGSSPPPTPASGAAPR
jgi:hypothetical protein